MAGGRQSKKVAGLFLRGRDRVTEVDRRAALADVVAIPGRDLEHDFAILHEMRLSAQPAFQLQVGRFVQPVGLVVFQIREAFRA